MMLIFRNLYRKKRIPGFSSRPNHRNSVHPAKTSHTDIDTVKRVETLQECAEVDEFLNQSLGRVSTSDQDDDFVDSGESDEIESEIAEFHDPGTPLVGTHSSVSTCLPSCNCSEPKALNLSQHAHLPSCKAYSSNKQAAQNSSFTDKPVKSEYVRGPSNRFRQARPAKLACVRKDKGICTTNRDLPSEKLAAPYPCRVANKKIVDHIESFPLPLPFEKHYLPSPQIDASEGFSPVAHPLPQPPSTPVKSFGDKDQTSIAKVMQRIKCASSQVLAEVPEIVGPTAVQSQAYHTPQSTRPTTPNQQVSWMLYNTPPTTPPSNYHGTPQNTPPRTPCLQALHVPQEVAPVMLRAQCYRTPPNTPRSSPSPRPNSQSVTDKTKKTQPLPSPNNKKSPGLKLKVPEQSSFLSAPEQSHCAYSPPSSPLPGSFCPQNWVKGALLGRGTFGYVYEGFNLEDGSFFAVKVSSVEDTSPEIQQEVNVLSKLDHPNIVRYLGSSIVQKQLCIFLELMTMGSLEFNLRKYKRFEEQTIRNYTKQILLGLEYLHRKRTIHRDIKCANILVDVNGQVKLSDFGIAKQMGESLASSVKGTLLYMAPEVLASNTDRYSFPADIWSVGCTVLEMADGKPPWSNLQGLGFLFKLKEGELPPLPESLSAEGRDFIQCCLKLLPKDRSTASELLQHPFVVNAVTPECLLVTSQPASPLVPLMWPSSVKVNMATWANALCCPTSPNKPLMTAYSTAQTLLVHGR